MRGKPGGIKTDGYSVDAGAKYNHRELVAFLLRCAKRRREPEADFDTRCPTQALVPKNT